MKNLVNKTVHYLNRLSLTGVVWAQDRFEIEPPPTFSKLGDITVMGIVSAAIKFALIIAALIAFIFLVIGGIRWITSGGDKEGTAKAQSTITAALVGLVIVFAAWAIMRLLAVFFGIEIFEGLDVPVVD